jgi:hypothetical protein
MNPRFYRLRKGTVEEVLVPRRGDGEMRKGLLKSSPPDEQLQIRLGMRNGFIHLIEQSSRRAMRAPIFFKGHEAYHGAWAEYIQNAPTHTLLIGR